MSHNVVLSVVVPVFNEGSGLQESVAGILEAVRSVDMAYEVLLVDDGSSDDSWLCIKKLAAEDAAVKGVQLSRNYGKESAIFAGLSRTKGDYVVVMDADLQHPPAEIVPMVQALVSQGLDVMNGIKRSRGTERLWYRMSAAAFNGLFSRLSGMDLEAASDFKVLSRQVVDSLLELKETDVFFRGLSSWVGFKHGTYEFDVGTRKHGQASWSLPRLFALGVSAITSYTSSMLHLVSIMGFVFMLSAFVLGVQTLMNKLAGHAVDGFTTVILLLLLIGALIMVSLGIIGQYIAKIYEEVKGRPRYLVRDET